MEMLYQYLWKQRMMGRKLTTVHGDNVQILYAGTHNEDAGPDFTGARLRIGSQEWAGNVEIHVKASDWHRHGHDHDPAYHNVILHVVAVDDARITRDDGSEIPQTVAAVPLAFMQMYDALSAHISDTPCRQQLPALQPLTRADWLASLAVERLQEKAERICACARSLLNDWNQTCFVSLARALGFRLNGDPMEMLARSIPLNILHHHCDDMLQLEALLFGQAGMLDTSSHIFDEYYQNLGREYFFLARKYGLRPMNQALWKYARTRPGNFPQRRIALLARALLNGFPLMGDILDRRNDPDRIRELFRWHADGYWDHHSDFDIPGTGNALLSETSLDLLMINFAAPLLYAYGASHGDPDLCDRAFDIWESLQPENNRYIRQWTAAGITSKSASDSQALIQLRTKYCDHNRCLQCRFAAAILKSTIQT